jgi:hypothetical protein
MEWRPVKGFEGRYEVSDAGLVRSLDRYVDLAPSTRFPAGMTVFRRGRVLRPHTMPYGHQQVMLGRETNVLVHHLIAAAFLPPPPEGHEICHNDGDATNNRVSNLRWDTRSGNNYDHAKNDKCKISQETVQRIKADKGTYKALAEKYNISASHVWNIKNGAQRVDY